MKKITIVFLAMCAVLLAGCDLTGTRGNGRLETDARTVSSFSNINLSGAFIIDWQSGAPTLHITTDENLLPHIETQVSNDTLRIRTREHLRPTHGIKVLISSPTRTGAKMSGAVKLAAKQLSGPTFALKASGASRISLEGNVDRFLADMTGASELAANDLHTKIAEISTTGAGNVEIQVAETLKAAITGAGKVEYSGNPATVEKHISGAGSIRHKD